MINACFIINFFYNKCTDTFASPNIYDSTLETLAFSWLYGHVVSLSSAACTSLA